jgi:hypothetical protein
MTGITKKLCGAVLALALLCASGIPIASAQSFGYGVSGRDKAAAIGGGAAAGAVVGALLGGRRGAVIGGLLGAGGGSAYVYAKGRENQDRYGYYRDRGYYNDYPAGRYYGDRDSRRYDRDDQRWHREGDAYRR